MQVLVMQRQYPLQNLDYVLINIFLCKLPGMRGQNDWNNQ